MLFSSLHGHAVGDVVVLVLGDSDDPARHFTLELVLARKVGRVWPTEAHGNAEPLNTATSDVSTHLSRRLTNGQRQDILHHDGSHFVLPQPSEEL